MLTNVQIVTPPATEPTTVIFAKQHCRIDADADDNIVGSLITAARVIAEQYLGRALITQTLLWTAQPRSPVWRSNHFLHEPLILPRPPVQSISTVSALDTLGNATTISAATLPVVPPATLLGYMADLTLEPARLVIGRETVMSDGRTLKSVNLQHIQVQLVAGYGDATTIPQPIINAILIIVAFLYEHRGDAGGDIPQAAQWLLDPYRVVPIA